MYLLFVIIIIIIIIIVDAIGIVVISSIGIFVGSIIINGSNNINGVIGSTSCSNLGQANV